MIELFTHKKQEIQLVLTGCAHHHIRVLLVKSATQT